MIRNSLCILLSICAVLFDVPSVLGQSLDGDQPTEKRTVESSFFQGIWSYRSFRSNPDLTVPANDLLFGSGTMEISISDAGQLTGTLGGTGWQLNLTGTATNGSPSKIQFQGKGTIGNEEWIYDYVGFEVPKWSNGVDQRPAIVGSIVRTVPHSGGAATAGYVAQWIAVKQDAVSPPDNENGRSNATDTEAELQDIESQWAKAVATNDPAQIGKFFSEDFLFVGAGGILQDRQQHLDDFQSGRLKIDSVEISEFTTHIYEGFAVVNTLVTVNGKLGERDISGVYRFMDTLRLERDQWLAVARQQTRSIVSNTEAQIEFKIESANYKFVVDAVDNPPLKVQQGSQIKVSLTSRQGSHDWVLANVQGTVLARTSRVSAGQPSVTVEFTASDLGEMTYYCSVGNHRVQGMEGKFIVEATLVNAVSEPRDRAAEPVKLRELVRHNPSEIHPPFGNLYSHGVEIPSGMRSLHIAGQAGVSKSGDVPVDPDAQLDLAWGNLKAVLSSSGMSVNDLVKVTCYMSDEKYTDAYAQSVLRHLPGVKPAMTAPIVRRLWSEKWYFEIEAIAAAHDGISTAAIRFDSNSGDDSKVPAYLRKLGKRYIDEENKNAPSPKSNESSDLRFNSLIPGASNATSNRPGEIELNVDYHTFRIGRDDVRLRCYNKNLCGPVIRFKAGETVYITLRNKLPVEPALGHGQNTHHMWNTTNLHFHGLHIAPQGPTGKPDEESDNVLLELEPTSDPAGSIKRYALRIPANHVAGTFWYHAHRHGSTAGQVASGMSGPFIIERSDNIHNLDSIQAVKDADEEIMFLQQIPYLKPGGSSVGFVERSSDGSLDNDWADLSLSPGQWSNPQAQGGLGRYVTVNGTKIPTITMAPGEVRRLRLIHSGQRERINLRIERAPGTSGAGDNSFPFHEIAVDGLPTGDIRLKSELELFPGYRSDALIQPSQSTNGEFYLVDTMAPNEKGADGSDEPLRWVAKIIVTGSPKSMSLPTNAQLLPHRFAPIASDAVQGTQYAFYGIVFTTGPSPVPQFFISQCSADLPAISVPSGRPLNSNETRLLTLNRTERWIVGTRNGPLPDGRILQQVHPFHIHTNPFFIEEVRDADNRDVTATEVGGPTWRDTLAMKQGYTYKLLTRYEDFTGDFVNHCHILDHEDNGMMEKVTIYDPSIPTPVPFAATGSSFRVMERSRKPSVMFFVKGSLCPHCMGQLTEMAKSLAEMKLDVTVVSASTEDDLKGFPDLPFRLVADPEYKLFKEYGAYSGKAMHATIVRDRSGKELLRKVGEEPFMDVAAVLTALSETSPSYVIAVRESVEVDDDYLTWSPTACTIRMVNGDIGSGPVTVTLTNDDPSTNPNAGELRFAETLLPNSTATLPTLTLQLNPDGTPVKFFVAGIKASTLTPASLGNGGRDTKIVIHQGSGAGPKLGEHAVMVRVRKNIDDLEVDERDELLKAFSWMHNRRPDSRYEWYVRLHRLAGPARGKWRDQAHKGSAFIAWHRAFLLQFEREIQTRFPHVAIPYWSQGEPQVFFDQQFLGRRENSSPIVRFDPLNPLDDWQITLPKDPWSGSLPVPAMGLLERSSRDHNIAPQVGSSSEMKTWPYYVGRTSFASFVPEELGGNVLQDSLEFSPHDVGHGFVGPRGRWMSNCKESPADPVFWVFHCHHDHLWALWQREYGYFDNTGSDPRVYEPNKNYTLGHPDAFGHHLKDTMWPWDEKNGVQHVNDFNSNRPTLPLGVSVGKFPKSPFEGLWPPNDASPRPAEMIDYQGIHDSSNDMGFCYDDVPFGSNRESTDSDRPLVNALMKALDESSESAMRLFLSEGADADFYLATINSSTVKTNREKIRLLLHERTVPLERRATALQLLIRGDREASVGEMLELVNAAETPPSLAATSIDALGQMMHFTSLSSADIERIHTAFVVAANDRRPAVAAAAVAELAAMGAPEAEQRLVEYLQMPAESPIRRSEVIRQLGSFPEQAVLLREELKRREPEGLIATIESLANDQGSLDARLRIATSQEYDLAVRAAAIRSLVGGLSQSLPALDRIYRDPSAPLALREVAGATIRNSLRRAENIPEVLFKSVEASANVVAETDGFGRMNTLTRQINEELARLFKEQSK